MCYLSIVKICALDDNDELSSYFEVDLPWPLKKTTENTLLRFYKEYFPIGVIQVDILIPNKNSEL